MPSHLITQQVVMTTSLNCHDCGRSISRGPEETEQQWGQRMQAFRDYHAETEPYNEPTHIRLGMMHTQVKFISCETCGTTLWSSPGTSHTDWRNACRQFEKEHTHEQSGH